jgi:predicted enzyme related to lactoylglutathione lyase
MDWKLELIVVPVSDIDRAKAFYLEQAGFDLLVDVSPGGEFRVVQLTPPGSHCSIALMANPDAAGNVQGLHLVVDDIEAAHAALAGRGANPGDPHHYVDGKQLDGIDPDRTDYGTFLSFADPDGNGWLVQEVGHGAG